MEKFTEHYPNFKVTMFTVPWEIRFTRNGLAGAHRISDPKFKYWVDAVNDCPWIEIALHGLSHAPMEFAELDYEAAKKRLIVGMRILEHAGIKNFTKIFKAPFWALSTEGKQAAEDLGLKVVEDGYYNWNLANDNPDAGAKEPYIMHGHVQDTCDNGLVETQHRIMSLPSDTEFLFLSEIFNTEKGNYDFTA